MFRQLFCPSSGVIDCVTVCGIIHPQCCTQSGAPEDERNNCTKYVELTGIINKSLLLHIVACLYYLYQLRTVKQISDNEIYLLIKYIKSILWSVAKRLSYIQDARCLKVKAIWYEDYVTECHPTFEHIYFLRLVTSTWRTVKWKRQYSHLRNGSRNDATY